MHSFKIVAWIMFSQVLFNLAKLSTQTDTTSDDVLIINAFFGCSINVINFRGLDISFPIITQPVQLLRYFAFHRDGCIYPFEHSPVQAKLFTGNHSIFYDNKKCKAYSHIWQTNRFRLGIKNTVCEAIIYLNPPKEQSNRPLYAINSDTGVLLKDPFWLFYYWEQNSTEEWRNNYLNTRPKYSLLVCKFNEDSSCFRNSDLNIWLSTTLDNPVLVRMYESIHVLIVFQKFRNLYRVCLYCDPCNPYHLTLIFTLPVLSSNSMLDHNKWILKRIDDASPYLINVVLLSRRRQYKDLRSRRTRNAVLEHITKFSYRTSMGINTLVDLHLFTHLLPKNSSIHFHPFYSSTRLRYINLKINSCTLGKISYHPRLRPAVWRLTGTLNLGTQQEFRLVFHQQELNFVSCYKESLHWIHQLRELVLAFDVSTWLVLVLTFLILLKILKHVYSGLHKFKHMKYSYGYTLFQLFAAFIDQSTSMFSTQIIRKGPVFKLAFSFIPLVWLYLGNLYKGDNITRLTLNSPLIPFDTFESLLENRFDIRTRRHRLGNLEYKTAKEYLELNKQGNQTDFQYEHESYPFVSELWYAILRQRTLGHWRTFKTLLPTVEKSAIRYLNYSEMLPVWNNSGKVGHSENVFRILDMHMEACNKSAIILPREAATFLHNILDAKKKPVYFGKDIISKTYDGYRYWGYFPTRVLLRPRYYFQSGIVEWWRKYFDWSSKMKTKTLVNNQMQNSTFNAEHPINVQIYSLCIIPAMGFIFALASLVFYEINVFTIYSCFARGILLIIDFLNKICRKTNTVDVHCPSKILNKTKR